MYDYTSYKEFSNESYKDRMMDNIYEQINCLEYVSKNFIGTVEELESVHLKLDVLYNMIDEERR